MMDIYKIVDEEIVENGYWACDVNQKKELIDEALKKYILYKIKGLTGSNALTKNYDSCDNVDELFEILANLIPKNRHMDTIRHFTHYILNVASDIQGFFITWESECDKEALDPPKLIVREDGIWEKLETNPSPNEDYVASFLFIYDTFKNNFMVKEPVKQIEVK